jgi:hypothetical protein
MASPASSLESLRPESPRKKCCVFSTVAFAHHWLRGRVEWPIFAIASAAPASNRASSLAVNDSTDSFTRKETLAMKKLTLLAVLLVVAASSTGCCCCNWLRRSCAPACPPPCPPPCAPACPPPCDPCATAPVSYGAPMPVAPYTPPPQW